MKIDIITLFPEMFRGVFAESMMARAREKELAEIEVRDLRAFTEDRNNKADDKPFGGGAGMVIKPEPVFRAVARYRNRKPASKVILMTPQGKVLDHKTAMRLSKERHLIIICGHYEGFDERISSIVDEEISIGNYVLTGGEIPAMALTDCVVRLIPGVIKEEQSVIRDSFYDGLLDYPNYTRPRVFGKSKVPGVLLSGNHGEIDSWRFKQSIKNTLLKMPSLIEKRKWSREEKLILEEVKRELKVKK